MDKPMTLCARCSTTGAATAIGSGEVSVDARCTDCGEPWLTNEVERKGPVWLSHRADEPPHLTMERCVAAPAETNADNGFDKAPERYMGSGRETVDVMRDMAHARFAPFMVDLQSAVEAATATQRDGIDMGAVVEDMVASWLMSFACETHALKYEDRAGRKGDPAGDAEKAKWWRQMQAHVMFDEPDPREGRPGFAPYERNGGAK